MQNTMNNKLIFDLGFHNGDDTYLYLSKGFNVVAIEANPYLVNEGIIRFKPQIEEGKLILLNMAIHSKQRKVDFYIHPSKSHWSSCLKDMAESDGSTSTHIEVQSITLHELFSEYGIPYYLKVDIEGCDLSVAQQLLECTLKPKYVSFETSRNDYFGIFSYLYVSGYSKFQLVNQINNSEFSSGLFGEYLPDKKWLTLDEALTRYIKYKELKKIDNINLGIGWIDVHAHI